MIGDIRAVQEELENGFENNTAAVDSTALALYNQNPAEAVAYLTSYSNDAAMSSTARWKELGEFLMVKFLDGNVKAQNPDGTFRTNDYGMPDGVQFPGYSTEYYEDVVRRTGDKFLQKEINIR